MDECADIAQLLSAYEDGELEPEKMGEVARHLAKCDGCESVLAGYRALGDELRSSVSMPALEGFVAAVNQRIRERRSTWLARIEGFFGGTSQLGVSFATTALAAAVAIVTAIIVTPYLRPHPGVQVSSVSPVKVETQPAGQVAAAAPVVADSGPDSQAEISRLEAKIPSVAVWREPGNDTTVIWLPDQP